MGGLGCWDLGSSFLAGHPSTSTAYHDDLITFEFPRYISFFIHFAKHLRPSASYSVIMDFTACKCGSLRSYSQIDSKYWAIVHLAWFVRCYLGLDWACKSCSLMLNVASWCRVGFVAAFFRLSDLASVRFSNSIYCGSRVYPMSADCFNYTCCSM